MSADTTPLTDAIAEATGGCVLRVRVIPRAKKTAIDGLRNGALLVRLAAPPVDDAANEALLRYVAELFGVSRAAVRLVSGQRARDKRVSIEGITRSAAITRLSASIVPEPSVVPEPAAGASRSD